MSCRGHRRARRCPSSTCSVAPSSHRRCCEGASIAAGSLAASAMGAMPRIDSQWITGPWVSAPLSAPAATGFTTHAIIAEACSGVRLRRTRGAERSGAGELPVGLAGPAPAAERTATRGPTGAVALPPCGKGVSGFPVGFAASPLAAAEPPPARNPECPRRPAAPWRRAQATGAGSGR